MGSGGPPPEIDVITEYQGGSKTYRLRIDLAIAMDEGEHDELIENLNNDELAEAVNLVLGLGTFDAATQKVIKVAINPSAYSVTAIDGTSMA